MIYVRNKLIDLFREAYDLILGMQQVFFIRGKGRAVENYKLWR